MARKQVQPFAHASRTLRRRSLAVSLLMWGGTSACEEPRFSDDDGAVRSFEGCDGGNCFSRIGRDAQPAGSMDVRANWEGRYAVRTHLYLVDGLINTDAELLSLVEIKRQADGLIMEQQLCLYDGGWSAVLFLGRTRFEYPNLSARAAVTFDADTFSSDPLSTSMGTTDAPAACSSATTAPASPAQRWLSGTCDCPKPNSVPANARDCRVSDPDNDGNPGFTTHGMVNADVWTYYITQQQKNRFVAGYRQGDRLYANVEHEDKTQTMGCADKSPAGCPASTDVSCPGKYNRAELVPIADDVDCARIITQENVLFRVVRAPFPTTCKNDLTNPSGSP